MDRDTLLCLNPASAAGRTGRRQAEILDQVEAVLGPVACEVTRSPGDAARIAQEARARGVRRLLVGGGDGTVHEIAQGLLAPGGSDPATPTPILGLLPLGSGWDLARSLDLPRGLEKALAVVARGQTRRIDAGRVVSHDASGAPVERCFVNEASAGLSADTIARVGRLSKRVGAALGFAAGAVGAIFGHRPFDVAIDLDGERIYEGPTSLCVAANGRCFGAGMRVAPEAALDDGLLEVVIVRGLSVPTLLANLPSLFAGTHGGHPAVSFHRGKRVALTPKGAPAGIDLDGEDGGMLPMCAEILPDALSIFAPEGVG